MDARFRFQRGEDITVFLAITGDATEAANVASVTAVLKPMAAGPTVPGPEVMAAAEFVSTAALAPPDPTMQPGWYLSISAAHSAALAPGNYVTNAKLTYVNGAVEITDPLIIVIQQSTAP